MITHSGHPAPTTRYYAYDRKTGRILGMHSRFSVGAKSHVRMNYDELTKHFLQDTSIIADLTGRDTANLDILEISDPAAATTGGPLMVDTEHRRLVVQPRLVLVADKTELVGDGVDSATIRLEVHAANGHVLHGGHGPVKVTTTRGRLSARAGLIELENGAASISLTSVAETVSNVRVQAKALNALYADGTLTFEFV